MVTDNRLILSELSSHRKAVSRLVGLLTALGLLSFLIGAILQIIPWGLIILSIVPPWLIIPTSFSYPSFWILIVVIPILLLISYSWHRFAFRLAIIIGIILWFSTIIILEYILYGSFFILTLSPFYLLGVFQANILLLLSIGYIVRGFPLPISPLLILGTVFFVLLVLLLFYAKVTESWNEKDITLSALSEIEGHRKTTIERDPQYDQRWLLLQWCLILTATSLGMVAYLFDIVRSGIALGLAFAGTLCFLKLNIRQTLENEVRKYFWIQIILFIIFVIIFVAAFPIPPQITPLPALILNAIITYRIFTEGVEKRHYDIQFRSHGGATIDIGHIPEEAENKFMSILNKLDAKALGQLLRNCHISGGKLGHGAAEQEMHSFTRPLLELVGDAFGTTITGFAILLVGVFSVLISLLPIVLAMTIILVIAGVILVIDYLRRFLGMTDPEDQKKMPFYRIYRILVIIMKLVIIFGTTFYIALPIYLILPPGLFKPLVLFGFPILVAVVVYIVSNFLKKHLPGTAAEIWDSGIISLGSRTLTHGSSNLIIGLRKREQDRGKLAREWPWLKWADGTAYYLQQADRVGHSAFCNKRHLMKAITIGSILMTIGVLIAKYMTFDLPFSFAVPLTLFIFFVIMSVYSVRQIQEFATVKIGVTANNNDQWDYQYTLNTTQDTAKGLVKKHREAYKNVSG